MPTAPTTQELKKGPVVTLASTRFAAQEWSPHGLAYPIRFDSDGCAVVYEPHFDEWVGDEMAKKNGLVVTRPKPPAAETKAPAKKAAAKKPTTRKAPAKKATTK